MHTILESPSRNAATRRRRLSLHHALQHQVGDGPGYLRGQAGKGQLEGTGITPNPTPPQHLLHMHVRMHFPQSNIWDRLDLVAGLECDSNMYT